jgi:hypothetical protein
MDIGARVAYKVVAPQGGNFEKGERHESQENHQKIEEIQETRSHQTTEHGEARRLLTRLGRSSAPSGEGLRRDNSPMLCRLGPIKYSL